MQSRKNFISKIFLQTDIKCLRKCIAWDNAKSNQNVPKLTQLTPEIPKSMHLGHIFLLGLAKQFFFTVPLPSPNRGNPPILQMAFRSPFFVSKVKKNTSGHN